MVEMKTQRSRFGPRLRILLFFNILSFSSLSHIQRKALRAGAWPHSPAPHGRAPSLHYLIYEKDNFCHNKNYKTSKWGRTTKENKISRWDLTTVYYNSFRFIWGKGESGQLLLCHRCAGVIFRGRQSGPSPASTPERVFMGGTRGGRCPPSPTFCSKHWASETPNVTSLYLLQGAAIEM